MVRRPPHRPQRPHNAALAVPRAVERATSGLATGPTHLASHGGNIAPRARHLGEQLAVTVTLGRAVVVVAPPAGTHPAATKFFRATIWKAIFLQLDVVLAFGPLRRQLLQLLGPRS